MKRVNRMRQQVTERINQLNSSEPVQKILTKVREVDYAKFYKNVNFWVLIFPVLVALFYFGVWASERYESRSMVTVQVTEGGAVSLDPMAMMLGGSAGLGGSAVLDAQLVRAFVTSHDMLDHLEETVGLRELYTDRSIDLFSRLDSDATREEFYDFYLAHVTAEVDTVSGIITITSQGFNPASARMINRAIVAEAEAYINSITRGLARKKLEFMTEEASRALDNLKTEQRRLLEFQSQYGLLDPQAEGLALQQITYGVEGQIAAVESQLLTLKQTMTENAPEVLLLETQLTALREQLASERSRLSQASVPSVDSDGVASVGDVKPVSAVLADYADLKLSHELALQAYSSTQMNIEAATVDSYRQAKHLVTLERSTLPEGSQYPKIFYNTLLLFVILAMLNAIVRIVIATVKELG